MITAARRARKMRNRSEEHTSELQSRSDLVCRLLLEKKKRIKFMKYVFNATPLPTVNTTGDIDHAAFLGSIIPDNNKLPSHFYHDYLHISNHDFTAP